MPMVQLAVGCNENEMPVLFVFQLAEAVRLTFAEAPRAVWISWPAYLANSVAMLKMAPCWLDNIVVKSLKEFRSFVTSIDNSGFAAAVVAMNPPRRLSREAAAPLNRGRNSCRGLHEVLTITAGILSGFRVVDDYTSGSASRIRFLFARCTRDLRLAALRAEQLNEELLHRFPGTHIRPLIVGHAGPAHAVGRRIGEAMHRAAIEDHLKIHARSLHLVRESGHLLEGDEGIPSAVAHQYLGLDL